MANPEQSLKEFPNSLFSQKYLHPQGFLEDLNPIPLFILNGMKTFQYVTILKKCPIFFYVWIFFALST